MRVKYPALTPLGEKSKAIDQTSLVIITTSTESPFAD